MHLFLVQTHKEPAQIQRLVRTLRRGYRDSIVLVSHNAPANGLDRAIFGGDSAVHVIDGAGGRGDFGILDGYLCALRWARDNKIEYNWLTNLSGQDYPVSSLNQFAMDIAQTEHDGFLHHFDVLDEDSNAMGPMHWPRGAGYDRYYFQYRKLKQHLSTFERAVLRLPRQVLERLRTPYRISTSYGLMIGQREKNPPFDASFRCYAGSYWHTIRAHCTERLLNFCEEDPGIVNYFRKVLIPDEAFIQTVLVNCSEFTFANDNRRYYDMRGSRHGHPKTLSEADLSQILGGPYVFARKFEWASGPALFDTLDLHALDGVASTR